MIIINRRIGIFKKKEIWFADPTDSRDCAYIGFWSRKMIDIPQFNRSEFFTILLDLTQSLDQIYSNMRKEFIRKQIEKGIRDKIKIIQSDNFNEFYKLNKQLSKIKGITFNEKINILRKGKLFLAFKDNNLLAGTLFLEDSKNIRLWFTASKRFDEGIKKKLVGEASRLIIWEAIKYAKAKGIHWFDMGGISINPNEKDKYSITLFKQGFGGTISRIYYYDKYYSRLFKLLKYLKQRY